MHIEVSVAVNFVVSFLYGKLPRRRVHMFGEELDTAVRAKFLGHWYPEQPLKGTAYRSLKLSGDHPDPIMFDCARETGMEVSEIFQHLPDNLTLWIDPGEVSYRIGEKGAVTVLYTDKQQSQPNHQQPAALDCGLTGLSSGGGSSEFNPEAQDFVPIADQLLLAQNFANLGLGTGQPSPPISQQQLQQQQLSAWSAELNSYLLQKSSSAPNFFTAAAFAQTKFGSTKLRQQTRRPNRLNNGCGGETGGRPARQPRGFGGMLHQQLHQHQHQQSHHLQHQQSLQHQYQPQVSSNGGGGYSPGNFSTAFNRSFSLSPGASTPGCADWSTGVSSGPGGSGVGGGSHLLSVHIPGGGGSGGSHSNGGHHSNGSSRQTSPGSAAALVAAAAAAAAVSRQSEQLLLAK